MSTDYIVASLPALRFGEPPAITWEKFASLADVEIPSAWTDLETQLRNALVEARGGDAKFRHAADGCSLYWKSRVLACFQEKDVLKRDELLDRVRWDAAGELTPPTSPLGRGALATYAIRLRIALRRAKISTDAGNAAFDRLTAETKREPSQTAQTIQTF